MLKRLSLIAAFLLSSTALAGIQVTDKAQGAWLRVIDNNKPSVNAQVSIINFPMQSETYLTDGLYSDNGTFYTSH